MNIFILISLILAGFSGVFSLVRQLQMLQQNSYFPSRYYKWIKESYTIELSLCCIMFCFSSFLNLYGRYILQTVFFAVLFFVRLFSSISCQKNSIKKIVVTWRVRRLFITAIIVFAVLIFLYVLFYGNIIGHISSIILMMLSLVMPLLTSVIWAITYPIEKCVTNHFIGDAKKILKNHSKLTVIGVTGSYGKTSVKFILNRILSEKFNVVATPHSFNTPMGVVRTVRNDLKPQTQIFICEMGAKNIGDIKEICDIANPDMGIITSVGPQHLETFKTVKNVFKTKFELAYAVSKNNGAVYINGDSEGIKQNIDTCGSNYKLYGTNSEYDYFAKDISYGKNGTEFILVINGEEIEISSKLLGMHSVINIVSAAAVAYDLGVSANDIKFAVSSLKPTEHRLELKHSVNDSLLIDDAYNANPEGSIEAIHVLSSFENYKKVIITPGLIELGVKEYDYNFDLGVCAAKFCDIIILVGKNRSKPLLDAVCSTEFNQENVFVVSSFMEAMGIYQKIADNNTVVLLENDLPDNYLN